MKESEFREQVRALLETAVDGAGWDDKLSIVRQAIVDVGKQRDYDQSNRGKSWTDEELRFVLQHAPTKENCLRLAYTFKRGYGSIEQIFRWAATPGPEVERKRPNDAFVQQIKRAAKQVGWRAT